MYSPAYLYSIIYVDDAYQEISSRVSSGRYVDMAPSSSRYQNYRYYYYFNIDSGYTYGTDVFIYPIDGNIYVLYASSGSSCSFYIDSSCQYSQPSDGQLLISAIYRKYTDGPQIDITKARVIYLH